MPGPSLRAKRGNLVVRTSLASLDCPKGLKPRRFTPRNDDSAMTGVALHYFCKLLAAYRPTPSPICKINQKIAKTITTTTNQMKTSIIGSMTFAKRLISILSSPSYIERTLSTEFVRFADSSPTLIMTDTSLGTRSVSPLSPAYIVSHLCNHKSTRSSISWYAGIPNIAISNWKVCT